MKKQIVIHVDNDQHAVLKAEAKANFRTIAQQIVARAFGLAQATPLIEQGRRGSRTKSLIRKSTTSGTTQGMTAKRSRKEVAL